MNTRADGDADENIDEYAADDAPRIVQNRRQALHERYVFGIPSLCCADGLRLDLPDPGGEQPVEFHPAENPAADHAHKDAAGHIDSRYFPAECAGEHRHGHLVDER